MKPTTVLLLALVGCGACGVLGMWVMQEPRVGISVENRSERTVRVHTLQLTAWKDREMRSIPADVPAGETAPIDGVSDPTSVWVVFDDVERRRPLGMVRVSERDRRSDEYVVPYPPAQGRLRRETPLLPGTPKRGSTIAESRERGSKGDVTEEVDL